MSNDSITVTTPRGNKYTYYIHPIASTKWSNKGGNYMFGYLQQNGSWQILYVGLTNDFAARFANHDKLNAAIKKGAKHILAHVNENEAMRKNEEAELIGWLKPTLNELLK